MPRDTEKWQQITGYSRDYDSTQKVLSRRHFGNDKHQTKDDPVRTYEKIRGVAPQTDMSLQEGLYNRMTNELPSYLKNYSFEDTVNSATYWTLPASSAGTATIVTSSANHGNYCLQSVTTNTASFINISSSYYIPSGGNQSWDYEMYWKGQDCNDAHIKVNFYRGDTVINSALIGADKDGTWDWTCVSGNFTTSNNSGVGKIAIFLNGGKCIAGSASAVTWFDSIKMQPSSDYPSLRSEEEWVGNAISLSADLFGQWRCPFEDETTASNNSAATFTRTACSATYTDRDGKLQYLTAANIPRYENSKFDKGVWIEMTRANILKGGNTDGFITTVSGTLASGWGHYQNGGTFAGIANFNSASDSVFGTTSQMIACPAAATASWRGMSQGSLAKAANSSYTASFYAKRDAGVTGIINLYIDEAGGQLANTSLTLNTDWTRHQYTFTSDAASAGAATMYLRTSSGSPGVQAGLTAYLNAIQFEQGKHASTYIPTTTVSATRNADSMIYATPPKQFDTIQGTFSQWFKPLWDGNDGAGHYLFWNDDRSTALSGSMYLLKDSDNVLYFRILDDLYATSAVSATIAANSISGNSWNHVAATWDNGTLVMYVNGLSAGATYGTGAGVIGYICQTGVGWSKTGFTIDALVDDFAIWDRPLTAAEIWQLYVKGH